MIRDKGAIEPLVTMLKPGASTLAREATERAAAAICNLANDNLPNQISIRQAGAVELLVALIKQGAPVSPLTQEHAAGAFLSRAFTSMRPQADFALLVHVGAC